MMEPKLLTLWQHIQTGYVRQAEIADLLELSPKQTSRYMQRWHEEGWFRLQPGKGRGHSTKIEWVKNVESIYEKEMEYIINHESIEKSAKWLTLHWSSECKLRLMRLFQTKLGFNDEGKDKLIIPRKDPFLSFHPLEALDIHSANLVSNIYNRLIYLTEDNEIWPELAHSWESSNRLLRLYIRKGVKFHDGSYLSADDVVRCLESLRDHPIHRDIWFIVQRIHSPAQYVVEINLKQKCSYILHLLSTINSSIYKVNNGKLIGTGSFYLEKNDETKTILRAFEDYYKERALLDCIEFVQMPMGFETIYRSSVKEDDIETYKVESDSGFGIVIMNAYRNSDINKQEVRDYIQYVISARRNEINQLDPKIIPNQSGILRSPSDPYIVDQVPFIEVSKPLVLQTTPYTEKLIFWLKGILETAGIPVKLKEITFEESLQNGYTDHGTDFFIHGEVFEMNHSLSFFHFLLLSSSPLAQVLGDKGERFEILNQYANTPFEKWSELHEQMERRLMKSALILPLYYSKRSVLFSDDIMNISIKNFGYADFSKLWMKPTTI
ncbi:ABC transporter substrate-binding protein [Pradoshia sp. D12]|uniref:ABC transporter substrate-binding protein n=2 Tax=Bacillaceae TaxID=186817 RepID=UPI001128184B|nr:ABC transporter substrate-binding protein [Pradoshia sp. D12]QFK71762.1 ABC transporter substrate-binding protein [Pradoshia sp. D12]TPF73557.1 ABC transporter substrate-binding protein [Bacillus sp. D12]